MTVTLRTLLYHNVSLGYIADYLRTGQRPHNENIRKYISALDDIMTYLQDDISLADKYAAESDAKPDEQERREILVSYQNHQDECTSPILHYLTTDDLTTANLLTVYQDHMLTRHSDESPTDEEAMSRGYLAEQQDANN